MAQRPEGPRHPVIVVAVAAVDPAGFAPDQLDGLARQLSAAIRDAMSSLQPPRRSKRPREKLLLSQREAAELLGVGRSDSLREIIRRGMLKTVRVNQRLKVTRASVEHLASVGFDLDEPAPRRSRKPAPKGPTMDVAEQIMRLKF